MKYGLMWHEDGHMKMYDLSGVSQCLKYLKEEKSLPITSCDDLMLNFFFLLKRNALLSLEKVSM